jgi:hypothetical protein
MRQPRYRESKLSFFHRVSPGLPEEPSGRDWCDSFVLQKGSMKNLPAKAPSFIPKISKEKIS